MPSITTFSDMKRYSTKNLAASRQLFESASSKNSYKPYTFVSYSSKDSEYLPYVLKVLTNHGTTPYVDKGDDRLPTPPSVKTAKILKDTIKKSKRMVVFVTTNSKDSKWVPWELGLGDGSKSNYDIALFPSSEKGYDTQWLEQEYLGLYSRIIHHTFQGSDKKVWMVYNHQDNEAVALEEWLS